ncbi:hypothetical protein AB4305_18475 [Nocardia sp. 2YAB30]
MRVVGAPERSKVYRRAQHALHMAEQARNRLLVDLVGDVAGVWTQSRLHR